jgi:hypothetical protein
MTEREKIEAAAELWLASVQKESVRLAKLYRRIDVVSVGFESFVDGFNQTISRAREEKVPVGQALACYTQLARVGRTVTAKMAKILDEK